MHQFETKECYGDRQEAWDKCEKCKDIMMCSIITLQGKHPKARIIHWGIENLKDYNDDLLERRLKINQQELKLSRAFRDSVLNLKKMKKESARLFPRNQIVDFGEQQTLDWGIENLEQCKTCILFNGLICGSCVTWYNIPSDRLDQKKVGECPFRQGKQLSKQQSLF